MSTVCLERQAGGRERRLRSSEREGWPIVTMHVTRASPLNPLDNPAGGTAIALPTVAAISARDGPRDGDGSGGAFRRCVCRGRRVGGMDTRRAAGTTVPCLSAMATSLSNIGWDRLRQDPLDAAGHCAVGGRVLCRGR